MHATVNLRHLDEVPQKLEGEISTAELDVADIGDAIIQAKEPLNFRVEMERQDRNLLVDRLPRLVG